MLGFPRTSPDLWGRFKQREADTLVELANTTTSLLHFHSHSLGLELDLDEANKEDMGFSEADVPLEDMMEPMIADDAFKAVGFWIRAQANTDKELLYKRPGPRLIV